MSMPLSLIRILLILVLVATLWGVSAYSNLMKTRNVIQGSWRQIDVELNRHYDLIPNLIETVRGCTSHERGILGKVTSLRQNTMALTVQVQGAPNEQHAVVESALTEATHDPMAFVESCPNLKSNTNHLELQRELTDTEDRTAASRRFCDVNVRDHNTRIELASTNIIAGVSRFERAAYFEANDPAVRQAPTVSFGQSPAEA